jgi:hypothetical protein
MGVVDLGADLLHEPVDVRVSWRSRVVVTRVPIAGEHQEWSIEADFSCASVPVLVALILRDSRRAAFGRLGSTSASQQLHVRLSFFPMSWYESDDVEVNLFQQSIHHGAGIRAVLADHRLKLDPRVEVHLDEAPTAGIATGYALRLASAERMGLAAEVAVIAASDTEARHGRWRLRERLATNLPGDYAFLVTGHRAGAPR